MTAVPRVALQDVASIERDIVEPSRIRAGTLYVGLENIESGGCFVNVRAVDSGELASSKFAFTPRHVLYGKLRPYLAKIARPDFDGICSTDILPVLPGPKLDRGYLSWLLLTPQMVALAASRATGANLPRLSPNALAEMELPLPPLPEQRRITAILDKADALRAKRRAALARLDNLTQSIFLDMFGDPVVNDRGWGRVPFSELLTSIDSGWSPNCLDRPALLEEWGVLKLGAVTWCEYDDAQNKALPQDVAPIPELEVREGDLLFTRKNTYELVGACALVRTTRPRLLLPDLVFRFQLRPDAPIEKEFLHRLLIHPSKRLQVQKLAGGSAGSMPNISKARLENLQIEVPPISHQRIFAERLSAVERLKVAQRTMLIQLNQVFSSIQHRAFRGEL